MKKKYMGLTTWENAPNGKILKTDVVIAKNYLSLKEVTALDKLVSMYLDFAERQAELNNLLSMEDWKEKLEIFLKINEYGILKGNSKIKREIADELASTEYEKCRVKQDLEYSSDFDILVNKIKNGDKIDK
ncbi:MAG TPA: RhuM family protein [Bacilli bacterium]|nr:RhuM family protein [Bacilli bacterium]